MNHITTRRARAAVAALLLACVAAPAALAQSPEALIRKNLAERLPKLPAIDEVRRMPSGLYELRIGTDILYTDERGDILIQGQMIDTKTKVDLTRERIDRLNQIDVAALPLKDALVWKQGSGERKIYVFADPNCGFCKQFERELGSLKNVTVYTFLLPILGADSLDRSRNIWCAKDGTKAWRDWMLEGVQPPKADDGAHVCDASALQRNLEMGKRYRVVATPTMVFASGKRVAGAMGPAEIEAQLAAKPQ